MQARIILRVTDIYTTKSPDELDIEPSSVERKPAAAAFSGCIATERSIVRDEESRDRFIRLVSERFEHPRNSAVVRVLLETAQPLTRSEITSHPELASYFELDRPRTNRERFEKTTEAIQKDEITSRLWDVITPPVPQAKKFALKVPQDTAQVELLLADMHDRSKVAAGIEQAEQKISELLSRDTGERREASSLGERERLVELLIGRHVHPREQAMLLLLIRSGVPLSRGDFFEHPIIGPKFFDANRLSGNNARYQKSLKQILKDPIVAAMYTRIGPVDKSRHQVTVPVDKDEVREATRAIYRSGYFNQYYDESSLDPEYIQQALTHISHPFDRVVAEVFMSSSGRPLITSELPDHSTLRDYLHGDRDRDTKLVHNAIDRLKHAPLIGKYFQSIGTGPRAVRWFDVGAALRDAGNTEDIWDRVSLETRSRKHEITHYHKSVISSRTEQKDAWFNEISAARRIEAQYGERYRQFYAPKTMTVPVSYRPSLAARRSLGEVHKSEVAELKKRSDSYDDQYSSYYERSLRRDSDKTPKNHEIPDESNIVKARLVDKVDLSPVTKGIPQISNEITKARSEKIDGLKIQNKEVVTLVNDWEIRIGNKTIQFKSDDLIDRVARNLFSLILYSSLVYEKKISILHIVTRQKEMGYGAKMLEAAWDRLKAKTGTVIGQASPINQNAWFIADHVVIEDGRSVSS